MRSKIPNTPFSTRLSGSAKETELRLRSIFQWKKKRPPAVLFILVVVLLLGICGGLVGFSSSPREGTLSEIYPEYFAEDAVVYIMYEDKADQGRPEPMPGSDEYAAAMEYLGSTEIRAVWGQRKYIGDFNFRNGAFYLLNEPNEPLKIELYPDGYMVISTGRGQTEDHKNARVYRAESFNKEAFMALWISQSTPDEPDAEQAAPPMVDEPPEDEKQGGAKVAPISGEALSPDGAYEVRLSGLIEGVSTDGLAAAEFVQVCDSQTGNVLWQSDGAYGHNVVWSPDGKRMALARTNRTGCTVTLIETIHWTAWNVQLPEHTYLPDHGNWIEWAGASEFRLTLGRGGDAGEEIIYDFGPENFPVFAPEGPEPIPEPIPEPTPEPTPESTPELTPEPMPEPEPMRPELSDPGWVLLTFADGTQREGWSSPENVEVEIVPRGGWWLNFHVAEEELEWAASVDFQKATVRFGGSEWEHPGEVYFSPEYQVFKFCPTASGMLASYPYYGSEIQRFRDRASEIAVTPEE